MFRPDFFANLQQYISAGGTPNAALAAMVFNAASNNNNNNNMKVDEVASLNSETFRMTAQQQQIQLLLSAANAAVAAAAVNNNNNFENADDNNKALPSGELSPPSQNHHFGGMSEKFSSPLDVTGIHQPLQSIQNTIASTPLSSSSTIIDTPSSVGGGHHLALDEPPKCVLEGAESPDVYGKPKRRTRLGGQAVKTAEVWRFFKQVPPPEQAAICQLCQKMIKATNSSTTGMIRHLRSCHTAEYKILQDARNSNALLKSLRNASPSKACNILQQLGVTPSNADAFAAASPTSSAALKAAISDVYSRNGSASIETGGEKNGDHELKKPVPTLPNLTETGTSASSARALVYQQQSQSGKHTVESLINGGVRSGTLDEAKTVGVKNELVGENSAFVNLLQQNGGGAQQQLEAVLNALKRQHQIATSMAPLNVVTTIANSINNTALSANLTLEHTLNGSESQGNGDLSHHQVLKRSVSSISREDDGGDKLVNGGAYCYSGNKNRSPSTLYASNYKRGKYSDEFAVGNKSMETSHATNDTTFSHSSGIGEDMMPDEEEDAADVDENTLPHRHTDAALLMQTLKCMPQSPLSSLLHNNNNEKMTYYESGDVLADKINQQIALMLMTDNSTADLVDRPGFRNLFKAIFPAYEMPSATCFNNEIIPQIRRNISAFREKLIYNNPLTFSSPSSLSPSSSSDDANHNSGLGLKTDSSAQKFAGYRRKPSTIKYGGAMTLGDVVLSKKAPQPPYVSDDSDDSTSVGKLSTGEATAASSDVIQNSIRSAQNISQTFCHSINMEDEMDASKKANNGRVQSASERLTAENDKNFDENASMAAVSAEKILDCADVNHNDEASRVAAVVKPSGGRKEVDDSETSASSVCSESAVVSPAGLIYT